jgi:hypothetical protein
MVRVRISLVYISEKHDIWSGANIRFFLKMQILNSILNITHMDEGEIK